MKQLLLSLLFLLLFSVTRSQDSTSKYDLVKFRYSTIEKGEASSKNDYQILFDDSLDNSKNIYIFEVCLPEIKLKTLDCNYLLLTESIYFCDYAGIDEVYEIPIYDCYNFNFTEDIVIGLSDEYGITMFKYSEKNSNYTKFILYYR